MRRVEAFESRGWHTTSDSMRKKLHANGGRGLQRQGNPTTSWWGHLPSTGASPLGGGANQSHKTSITPGDTQSHGVP